MFLLRRTYLRSPLHLRRHPVSLLHPVFLLNHLWLLQNYWVHHLNQTIYHLDHFCLPRITHQIMTLNSKSSQHSTNLTQAKIGAYRQAIKWFKANSTSVHATSIYKGQRTFNCGNTMKWETSSLQDQHRNCFVSLHFQERCTWVLARTMWVRYLLWVEAKVQYSRRSM